MGNLCPNTSNDPIKQDGTRSRKNYSQKPDPYPQTFKEDAILITKFDAILETIFILEQSLETFFTKVKSEISELLNSDSQESAKAKIPYYVVAEQFISELSSKRLTLESFKSRLEDNLTETVILSSPLGKSDTSHAQSVIEEQRLDLVRKANKIYLQESEAIDTLKLDVSAMNKGYSYIKRKNENLYHSETSNSGLRPSSITTSQGFGSMRGSGLSISSPNTINLKPALTNSDFVTTKEQIVTKKITVQEGIDSNGNKQIIKSNILTKETKRVYQPKGFGKMGSPGQKPRMTKMDTIDEDIYVGMRGAGTRVRTGSFFENQSVIFSRI